MCTVSWCAAPGGYELFFNRDELNARAPEQPPLLALRRGVRFLAPRDGDHGGTWLAVNEHGLTVCLLNDYSGRNRTGTAGPRESRGQLVLSVADAPALPAVARRIRSRSLGAVAPFWLLALVPGENPLLLHWSGAALACRHAPIRPPLLTSSSFTTAEVTAARQAAFRQFVQMADHPTARELTGFQRQHDPAAGAFSVAMQRPDAATRSFSHIAVNRRVIRFDYEVAAWPDAACAPDVAGVADPGSGAVSSDRGRRPRLQLTLSKR